MTSQQRTATLTEALGFVDRFKALIKEAEEAGLYIDVDVTRDPFDSTIITSVDIDLNFIEGGFVDTIVSVDY